MAVAGLTRPWYAELLACPECGRSVSLETFGIACQCGLSAAIGIPLDLRPRRTTVRTLQLPLGSSARADLGACRIERPRLTYAGPPAQRDSAELFSAAEPYLKREARFLDVGCGPRDQWVAADHYGLRYVGVDHDSAAADILADAHALPFRAETFEAVLAYAVLEHLYNPFLAAAEVARVLVPGGVFFGAVSQGEPYHESFFHHTALGLLTVLTTSGLAPLRLWPSYDTLHALAVMGRYATAVRWLIEGVHRINEAAPFLAPRKHFRWTEDDKRIDVLHRAASICFVARRSTAVTQEPEVTMRARTAATIG